MNFKKTNEEIAKEIYDNCVLGCKKGDRILFSIIEFVKERFNTEDFADILSTVTYLATINEEYHEDVYFDLVDDYVEYFFESYKKENDCMIDYAIDVESVVTEKKDPVLALFVACSIIAVIEEIEKENEEEDFVQDSNQAPEKTWKPEFKFTKKGITHEQHSFNLEQIRYMIEELQSSEMALKYVSTLIEILKKEINEDFAYKYFKMIENYTDEKLAEIRLGGNR